MPSNSEQLNLNIFDYSSVAYIVVELVLDDNGQPVDWIYRYCNQAFADIKEFRMDALLDHSFLSLFPKADEKWLQLYYQAAYEDKPCRMVSTIGEAKYCVTVMPIGKKGFCSCMIQPVEKLEDADATEKEQQEKRRYILDKLSPEYVSIYRIELNSGKYQILRLADNTNARALVGTETRMFPTFDEFSVNYADAFILDEDRQEFLDWLSCKNMKKKLQREDRINYHYQSVSQDGKYSYFEAYAVKGQVDEDNFDIFLSFRNIDSILYKEKAIQEKLKNALDEARLSNEIISAIAKTYQYVSRIDIQADYFEEISNRDETHLDFKKSGRLTENNKKVCRDVVAEEYQDAFFKIVDLTTLPDRMKDEETIVLEYRMKDGNWHRLRFVEKKRDENGRLTHVLCVIRSISDTKRREQSLLYEVDEAKKDAALKTRFLSNMSHDIRTPINGIIGTLNVANHYPDDLEVQQKCRNQIMESSKYLVALVNDILDMSKLESGDAINQEVPFDLTEMLNRANTIKQTQAADKTIDYVVDWDRSEITHRFLVGNPVYLERLLTIISNNAVKFTNPGGSIHVWCNEKSVNNGIVEYEFGCSDNGIGMNEDFIEHAFDMFSQENQTSRTNYEGTGLGLAIAKKIINRMGGTIKINSKKGIGTTVILTVPLKIGEEETIAETVDYKKVSVEGLRALIAEDNELNMELAKFMLENNGIQVECAKDGAEAVKRFEESEPGYYDAIYMDIMMPNLNGWDATRKIRSMKRPDSAEIPIIAMSANTFAEDIINSRISGMNRHLTKPLDEAKLLNALKECLGRTIHGNSPLAD